MRDALIDKKSSDMKKWISKFITSMANFSVQYNFQSVAVALLIMSASECTLDDDGNCKKGEQAAWVEGASEAAVFVGAVVGEITFGYLGDMMTRSQALLLTMWIAMVSTLISAFLSLGSPSAVYATIITFRFTTGIGLGGVFPLSATKAAEDAARSPSGNKVNSTASAFSFFWQLPALLGPWLLGYFFSWDSHLSVTWKWRLVLGLGVIPSFLTIVALMLEPEGGSSQTGGAMAAQSPATRPARRSTAPRIRRAMAEGIEISMTSNTSSLSSSPSQAGAGGAGGGGTENISKSSLASSSGSNGGGNSGSRFWPSMSSITMTASEIAYTTQQTTNNNNHHNNQTQDTVRNPLFFGLFFQTNRAQMLDGSGHGGRGGDGGEGAIGTGAAGPSTPGGPGHHHHHLSFSELYHLLATNPRLRHDLLVSGGCWFLYDIVVYGLGLLSGYTLEAIDDDDGDVSSTKSVRSICAQQLIALVATVTVTFLSIYLVAALGLKQLQLVGFTAVTLCCCTLAIVFSYLDTHDPTALFGLYCLCYASLNFGLGITTFSMPAALFPREVRTTFNGLAAAMGKVGAVLSTFTFYNIALSAGYPALLALCTVVAFLGCLLTFYGIDGTKLLSEGPSSSGGGGGGGGEEVLSASPSRPSSHRRSQATGTAASRRASRATPPIAEAKEEEEEDEEEGQGGGQVLGDEETGMVKSKGTSGKERKVSSQQQQTEGQGQQPRQQPSRSAAKSMDEAQRLVQELRASMMINRGQQGQGQGQGPVPSRQTSHAGPELDSFSTEGDEDPAKPSSTATGGPGTAMLSSSPYQLQGLKGTGGGGIGGAGAGGEDSHSGLHGEHIEPLVQSLQKII